MAVRSTKRSDGFHRGELCDAKSAQNEQRGLCDQIDVVASDIADLVVSADGWLFDLAQAGWQNDMTVADDRQNSAGEPWDRHASFRGARTRAAQRRRTWKTVQTGRNPKAPPDTSTHPRRPSCNSFVPVTAPRARNHRSGPCRDAHQHPHD